jgi:membrane-associated phospholipid phosphatase
MKMSFGEAGVRQPQVQAAVPRYIGPRWDLWRMCGTLLIGLALVCIGFLADDSMTRLLTLGPTSPWQKVANIISKAGEGWVIAAAGLATWGILTLKQRAAAGWGVFLITVTSLLTGAAATALRSVVGRTRPDIGIPQGFYGIWHDSQLIIGRYEFGSFPSGHTATAAGVAVAVWLLHRKLGPLAFVYVAAIAWSRVAMGCHHFSDVLSATGFAAIGAPLILSWVGPRMGQWSQAVQRAWKRRRAN